MAGGVVETNDLDWKSELPPAKGLPQTDFPKDIAAMANSGGGVIVYGTLKTVVGIRLDPEEEFDGADLTIHKITATPDRETHW